MNHPRADLLCRQGHVSRAIYVNALQLLPATVRSGVDNNLGDNLLKQPKDPFSVANVQFRPMAARDRRLMAKVGRRNVPMALGTAYQPLTQVAAAACDE
jgi:hypothetical protein